MAVHRMTQYQASLQTSLETTTLTALTQTTPSLTPTTRLCWKKRTPRLSTSLTWTAATPTSHPPFTASQVPQSVCLHLSTLASCWTILPPPARTVLSEVVRRRLHRLTQQLLAWPSSLNSTPLSSMKWSSLRKDRTRLFRQCKRWTRKVNFGLKSKSGSEARSSRIN